MRPVPPELAARLAPAATVFATRGFDAARIEDLTEATGVASSTLYYYFEGKREVLAFLLQEFLGRLAGAVATASRGEGNAHQRLERVIRTQIELMLDQPETCRVLLAELGRIAPLPDIAKAVNEAFHDPVAELLEHGAYDGSLRPVPVESSAAAIYGAVTISVLHYVVAEKAVPPDAIAGEVLDLLAHGYRTTP